MAGALAIFLALSINNRLSQKADSLFIPLIEETLKNGLAYIFNVSPIPVHIIFGFAEGLQESVSSKNYWLLGNALLGHGIYGVVAFILWQRPLLANFVSFLLHALYNTYILKKTKKI